MKKSFVTILVCPFCKSSDNMGLMLDKRLRKQFDMHTEASEPCDECKTTNCVRLFDKDTKKFIGYAKKELLLNAEALEKYKDTSLNALVKLHSDGSMSIYGESTMSVGKDDKSEE